MSVNPNFTNANAFTSFFGQGGAGGSNFPNGITIGSNVALYQGNIPANTGPPLGYAQTVTPAGINTGWLADPLWSGDAAAGYLRLGSTTMASVDGGGTNETNFLTVLPNLYGSNQPSHVLANISKMSGTSNTTTPNDTYNPINFTIRPDQAIKNGIVYGQLQWDAVDTGANYALVFGASSSNAIVTSIWPGYISMPLFLTGASVEIASDNETFLFMDGNAGALGNISTGTPFVSGSNLFSSITAPTLGVNANMSALLSTLASTYPACFS